MLPRAWYPDAVWGVVDQYVAKLGDNLVRSRSRARALTQGADAGTMSKHVARAI